MKKDTFSRSGLLATLGFGFAILSVYRSSTIIGPTAARDLRVTANGGIVQDSNKTIIEPEKPTHIRGTKIAKAFPSEDEKISNINSDEQLALWPMLPAIAVTDPGHTRGAEPRATEMAVHDNQNGASPTPLVGNSQIGDNGTSFQSWTPPTWITDYMEWHRKTRLEHANLTDPEHLPPILVVYCHSDCGGLHDRLGSLPFDFYAANQTRRLLLYSWKAPAELEEFLVPPLEEPYRFDWRVPKFLQSVLEDTKTTPTLFPSGNRNSGVKEEFWNETLPTALATVGSNHSLQLLTMKERFHNGEFFLEDKLRALGERDLIHLTPTFGWLWNQVFEPSPGLSEYIEKAKQAMGTSSGNYIAVHCRIHYPLLLRKFFGYSKFSSAIKTPEPGTPDHSGIVLEGAGKVFGVGVGLHALQCARTLLQEEKEPIYFFSDANNLVDYLTRNVSEVPVNQSDHVDVKAQPILQQVVVVSRPDIHERNYHIDLVQKPQPSLYYAVFADLYLAMEARCIVFGYGGFGRFAQQLTNNQCYLQHQLHIHNPFFGHSLNMHGNVCTEESYAHLVK